MDVLREDLQPGEELVTLGPCPGCELWQLDYTTSVAQQWITLDMETHEVYELASEDPVQTMTYPVPNLSAWHEVVEDALREHLDECLHLQRLLEAEGLTDLYT